MNKLSPPFQDTGGEYRSVLGLPGGINSPFIADFQVTASPLQRSVSSLWFRVVHLNQSSTFSESLQFMRLFFRSRRVWVYYPSNPYPLS